MQAVKSSTITHIGHDPESNELRIRFKHGGEYLYRNVTAEEHDALLKAESIGKHFHEHIRAKEMAEGAKFPGKSLLSRSPGSGR